MSQHPNTRLTLRGREPLVSRAPRALPPRSPPAWPESAGRPRTNVSAARGAASRCPTGTAGRAGSPGVLRLRSRSASPRPGRGCCWRRSCCRSRRACLSAPAPGSWPGAHVRPDDGRALRARATRRVCPRRRGEGGPHTRRRRANGRGCGSPRAPERRVCTWPSTTTTASPTPSCSPTRGMQRSASSWLAPPVFFSLFGV